MASLDERIYSTAIADGMPAVLANFIVAQARHETAGYTSNVFLNCNNCFGYKYVGQTLAAGACNESPEGDPYAAYNSIEDSVHEITSWIKRRQAAGTFPADLTTITTPDQYAQLLKNAGYYGDTVTNYANGLVYWLEQIGSQLTTPAGGISLLIVVLALGIIAFRKKLFGSKK